MIDVVHCALQGREPSVVAGTRKNTQVLLVVRCLLLESTVHGNLTMTDHAQAQQNILAMQQMYSRFPTLLAGTLHSIHMVSGEPACLSCSHIVTD